MKQRGRRDTMCTNEQNQFFLSSSAHKTAEMEIMMERHGTLSFGSTATQASSHHFQPWRDLAIDERR
jgi:hypothetical protein